MISPIGSALSGLQASARRIEVNADNIANQFSSNYTPKRVTQISQAGGGTIAQVSDVEPAKIRLFNPSDPNADSEGIVEMPNVDLANELVNMAIASYDFKANLKTIKVADNMQRSLLDIFS